MYNKSIIKPEHRVPDTKRSDRGDHTTGRNCQSPQILVDSEFQTKNLDGNLVWNCFGSYLGRVEETDGGTGDTGKLMARRQEEAAMKRMNLVRLMLQTNPEYGVRLSEKELRKIEAKMLKETQPLDIYKRRILCQMYTFRKPAEDKSNVIKEEALMQPDSPEMETEIEEPVEKNIVRTNKIVQTNISCSNNTKTKTATLPTQIPDVMAKGTLQGNSAGTSISNTPSQRKQSEIANVPSQRTSVQVAKETLQKKTGMSTPSAKNQPADEGKYPSDVGSQPSSQKMSVDTAENLDSYLVGNCLGSYLGRVEETVVGGTGDTSKLMARRQEEAAMKRMNLVRLMLQTNPEYGVRLSEKELRKIEAKMLKETQPLDINKRRILYQMYTFRKPGENKSCVIKEEDLTQSDSPEMESEIEETNESVQTDTSCSNNTKTDTATLPTQIPDVMAKGTMQGNSAGISNTPSQRKQSEITNVPSQRTSVQEAKETLQRKSGISTPSAKNQPADEGKYPSDVGSQPSSSQKISVDTAENLDGYLVGNCLGSYLRRVEETVGGTGDIVKLMAKRQEEAAMKRMNLVRLMLQANPEYGVRLSEKELRKIEAKMLKETQPLDINKRKMLYQTYTFRKPSDNKRHIRRRRRHRQLLLKTYVKEEEDLTQSDSTEMESEIEEPVEKNIVRTNEGVQPDIISCSNNTKTKTAILPTQIIVVTNTVKEPFKLCILMLYEFKKAENLDGYLVGNCLGSYLRRVKVGGTGDTGKWMARRQEEAAMKRMNLVRLMFQANPEYGVRLSEKELGKIEAKMLKETQPLDINKRRMLYQMYTFRKQSEYTSNVMKEETLTQANSPEMESEIEEPVENNIVRMNEGVQTDISCSYKTKAETATLPSKIPVVKTKETLQGNPANISNTPSQGKRSEIANVPSQRTSVQVAKETLQRKSGISTPSAKNQPADVGKYPSDVGSQPSQKISVDAVKEPSLKKAEEAVVYHRPPVDVAMETWQRKQAETLNPTLTPTPAVEAEKESLQRKQTQIRNQSVIQAFITNTTSPTQAKLSSQKTLSGCVIPDTNQRSKSPRRQLHTVNGPFQKQVNLPHLPRIRYARIPQTALVDKQHLSIEKRNLPVMKKLIVKSPIKINVQHPPLHTKYNPILTHKSLPTNHKRKPVIKTLTITQRGHSTKIYKAVSFVEQKKASLKIKMDHKSVSRAASSSRSYKSKHLSTSQESSSNHNSPKRVDSHNGKENGPSKVAKLVMNRRNKYRRRKRARSPDSEEAPPLQTEVAKWAPQSVNEHTKPYYEAWVNTTLTAVSSDNEHVRREKERIMELMRERLETCVMSDEELTDDLTGRITVVTHR